MIINENNKVEIHDNTNKVRGFERVVGFDQALLPMRQTTGSCGYDLHVYSATPTTIKSAVPPNVISKDVNLNNIGSIAIIAK